MWQQRNIALGMQAPQGKLDRPRTNLYFVLSLNVYYHKYSIFFKCQLRAQWQTLPFYTHVHLFFFLLVAFYDEKKEFTIFKCIFSAYLLLVDL